jgi:predicted GIY-YIG superfamily endonuclease
MHRYVCYCIQCESKTYVGITNNMSRRLKQHNKELTGGAKYTSSCGPWSIAMLLGPFATHQHALHFEWHWKHCAPKSCRGVLGRQRKLYTLLTKKIHWPLYIYTRVPLPFTLVNLTPVDSVDVLMENSSLQ